MYKEIIEELEKGQDFLDLQSPDKIIRFYLSDKEYEANEGVSPNTVLSSTYEKEYDLMILTLDKSQISINESEEKFIKLREACEPLIKYLNDNYHPHVTAIVTLDKCEIVEGLMSHVTKDFVKD